MKGRGAGGRDSFLSGLDRGRRDSDTKHFMEDRDNWDEREIDPLAQIQELAFGANGIKIPTELEAPRKRSSDSKRRHTILNSTATLRNKVMKEAGVENVTPRGSGSGLVYQNIQKELEASPRESFRSKSGRKMTTTTSKSKATRKDFAKCMTITVEDDQGNVEDLTPLHERPGEGIFGWPQEESRDSEMFDSGNSVEAPKPKKVSMFGQSHGASGFKNNFAIAEDPNDLLESHIEFNSANKKNDSSDS